MPLCYKCKDFFPPELCFNLEPTGADKECIFCHVGQNYITLSDDSGEVTRKYTRKECIRDYKKLCDLVVEGNEEARAAKVNKIWIPK